ncbi:HD domain-containing protein [Candidatus Saccharibacteria bacterium]|nr:HD domain-containing protein [Candidatus Saccharibacteria bacterium]
MTKTQEFDEFDKIWISYRMFKREADIARAGYYLCKVYPEPTEEDFLNRFESDLEHSAGVARLVSDMAAWFPELFPDVETAIKLAQLHDIGEIYIGDIADDGNPAHAQKEDIEQVTFLEWLYTQPEETWEDTYQYYLEFQEKSTPRGQALYIADKLEAILQLLNYELRGLYGDVRLKNPPSSRDLAFGATIGTYNATDVWACHFKAIVCDQFAPEITLPFIAVLDSAVTDVRGKWFPWWTFWQRQNHPLELNKTPVV